MKLAFKSRHLAVALLLATAFCAYADKKAPPLEDLSKYPAQETHPNEKVTIAVDPYDTRSRADFFHIDYVGHGFLPVRVIIRNDSDRPLKLDDARIQLVPAHGEKIPAALPSEINRRLFHIKDTQPKHIPGVPVVTYHKQPVDKKILQDQDDFGFKGTTVAPHSTLDGFLFYDINDLDDENGNPLKTSEIYIKQVMGDDGKAQLFPFSISLSKYFDGKPKSASTSADTKDTKK